MYIIAGPNGAGKTTASLTLLPELLDCEVFINADEIARGLSPFNPEAAAVAAGKIQLQLMDEAMQRGDTFAIETTLSGRTYINLIDKAHRLGYKVTLVFFYLPSVEMAIERVRHRVSEGGHNIPEDVIRRRYERGLRNLTNIYLELVDNWQMINNETLPGSFIAKFDKKVLDIINKSLYQKILDYGKGR